MIQKYIGHRPDLGLLVLRVVIGAVFLAHGIQKINGGMEGLAGFLGGNGIPMAMLMAWVLTAVETLGGLALILGIGTRIAAVLLGVVMIVAIATVKIEAEFIGGYELDLTLLAGNIALLLMGAGKYSLDKMWAKSGFRSAEL